MYFTVFLLVVSKILVAKTQCFSDFAILNPKPKSTEVFSGFNKSIEKTESLALLFIKSVIFSIHPYLIGKVSWPENLYLVKEFDIVTLY